MPDFEERSCNYCKSLFNEMANALAGGDRVEIRGLCSFYVNKYKSYAGRNPKLGKEFKWLPKNCLFLNVGRN